MKLNTDFIHPKDAPEILKASRANFLNPAKKLNVILFENADVHQGVKEAGVWINQQHLLHTFAWGIDSTPAIAPPPPQNICDEEAVFVGSFSGCWGHEITDHLKHLWFYFDENFAHLKNLKFVYTLFPYGMPTQNFFQLLESIGIPKDKFHCIDQPTRFKRLFVPDDCFFLDIQQKHLRYTPEFVRMLQRLPQLPAPKNYAVEKVYFSRLQCPTSGWNKRDFNEIELANFFKNQGFTIIYPEQIDFFTELAILQNCTIFAATEGSIAHNVLFCQKAQKALILRKARIFTLHQTLVNTLANPDIEIVYIDVSFSPFTDLKAWGPFFLYESNALRRYFALPPKAFPYQKFLSFFIYHYCRWLNWRYFDDHFLAWSRPLRDKLQIGRRIKKLFKILKNPR